MIFFYCHALHARQSSHYQAKEKELTRKKREKKNEKWAVAQRGKGYICYFPIFDEQKVPQK